MKMVHPSFTAGEARYSKIGEAKMLGICGICVAEGEVMIMIMG